MRKVFSFITIAKWPFKIVLYDNSRGLAKLSISQEANFKKVIF